MLESLNLPSSMYLVDSSDISDLLLEYDAVCQECDALCLQIDDEKTPYKSKYAARDKFDQLLKKLEATKAIAQLEMKKNSIQRLNVCIASLHVRLGVIAWECEEPHNTEIELEQAAEYYCNGYVNSVNETSPLPPESEEENIKLNADSYVPIPLTVNENIVDTMKCLNMMGILWAGRGYVKRSFLYLLCAKDIYEHQKLNNFEDIKKELSRCSKSIQRQFMKEFESQYTHNLFYLAQAYGNIGNSVNSSRYCKDTLQRQLDFGLEDIKSAYDWTKNASSIADYYLAINDFRKCSLALTSTEHILREKVMNIIQEESLMYRQDSKDDPTKSSCEMEYTKRKIIGTSSLLESDVQETFGDLCRRFVRMDLCLLKASFEINFGDGGVATASAYDNEDEELGKLTLVRINDDNVETVFSIIESNMNEGKIIRKREFYQRLPVPEMKLVDPREINSFEKAREVFLRAISRLETAKKIFVLDGWVSDHVSLLQDQSKLYHYLALYETDLKRKVAMESRRVEFLSPLLLSLSRSAFEALHKSISYELGETYLSLYEIKVEQILDASENSFGNTDPSLDSRAPMKKSDIGKCNGYCKQSIASFAHFSSFYCNSLSRQNYEKVLMNYEKTISLEDMLKVTLQNINDVGGSGSMLVPCMDPDMALITLEELRPFLNSHFLSCRMYQKFVYNSVEQEVVALTICLKMYEWLVQFTPKVCSAKGVQLQDYFADEYTICQEMTVLLPSKIDKVWRNIRR